MVLEKLVSGKVLPYSNGEFLLVEKNLRDMSDNPIKRFIEENREFLNLNAIRHSFPEIYDIPKREILFFDIETLGFSPNSPIFSIGLTHLTEGITTSCLFARDYSEEKIILQYFLDLLPQHHAFFTYNGASFDLPRLDKRMRDAHGISYQGTGLKERLNSHHLDLKKFIQRLRPDLPDHKLSTIEKLVFKMSREGDIPSSQVPKAYKEYVEGTDGEEKIARVISHNMRDTLTLVAVLAYASKRNRKFREI